VLPDQNPMRRLKFLAFRNPDDISAPYGP
jgi:hypothetical protein